MKRLALALSFVLLLTACSTPATLPAPTATATLVLPSETPKIAPTETQPVPTAEVVEINQLALENMGCLKNDMCLGLEVKDKEAAYTMFLEAFANAYENKDWMKAMKIRSSEEFRTFLQNSTHVDPATGEERAYWIPLTAPGGATFKILQGDGYPAGGIFSAKNPAIVEQGGFWLDSVGLVVASKTEIDANTGGVADWLDKMWEQNGKNVLIRSSSVRVEEFGITVVDGKVIFVVINNANPVDGNRYNDLLLGQVNSAQDAKIASAAFELCLKVFPLYHNSKSGDFITNNKIEPNSDKWGSPMLCVAGKGCDGQMYNSDDWFVPQE